MARRGGELEAFTAFLGGLLATGLLALALVGAGTLAGVDAGPRLVKVATALLGAVWVVVTLGIYLRLIARGRTRSGTRS
ncbi:hypothetical protein PUR61_07930 [Streptomyces sp. BE20]|uniref:hypothetical protein n=1 Tax=Streptomycetaceae TaxID=2062 RepID=UPI002E7A79A0|nr:hypothetical protein [Streptomyces sp. BE20]MEE1822121.1 hypothetical protein [Streptomyces sp. BE20]